MKDRLQEIWLRFTAPYTTSPLAINSLPDAIMLPSLTFITWLTVLIFWSGVWINNRLEWTGTSIVLLVGILTFPIPYHLSRSGRTIQAVHSFAIILWIVLSGTLYFSGTAVPASLTSLYILLPLLGFYFGSPIVAASYFALSLSALAFYTFTSSRSPLLDLGATLLSYSLTTFFMIFMIVLLRRQRSDVAEQLQQSEQARAKLLAKDKQLTLLSDFLNAITHDFRNRLSIIEMSRQIIPRLLSHPEATQKIEARVEKIGEQTAGLTEQLNKLILLMNTTVARGEISDIHALLADLEPKLNSLAQKKEITLAFELVSEKLLIDCGSHDLVIAIEQIFQNAINFTPEKGSVTIKTRQQGGICQIDIQDSGIGIAAEHLDRVFDPFYKVDPARSISQAGIGLGLSITANIVEAHNGQIKIDSSPGHGTTVTLTFPTVVNNRLSDNRTN